MNLLTNDNCKSYLVDIDKQANEIFSWLVKELAEKNVIEELKATN